METREEEMKKVLGDRGGLYSSQEGRDQEEETKKKHLEGVYKPPSTSHSIGSPLVLPSHRLIHEKDHAIVPSTTSSLSSPASEGVLLLPQGVKTTMKNKDEDARLLLLPSSHEKDLLPWISSFRGKDARHHHLEEMNLHLTSLNPPLPCSSSSSYLRSFSYPSPCSSQDEFLIPFSSSSSSSGPLEQSSYLRNSLSSSSSSFSSLPLDPPLSTAYYHHSRNAFCQERMQSDQIHSRGCLRESRETKLVLGKRKEDERGMAPIDCLPPCESIDKEARHLYKAKLVKRTCCSSSSSSLSSSCSPSSSPHFYLNCYFPTSSFFCLRRSISCPPPPLSSCSSSSASSSSASPVSGGCALLSSQRKSSIQQSRVSCTAGYSSFSASSTPPIDGMKRKQAGLTSLSSLLFSEDQQTCRPVEGSSDSRNASLRGSLLRKNPETSLLQSLSSSSSPCLSRPCTFSSCVEDLPLSSSVNQSDSITISSPKSRLHTKREGAGEDGAVEEEEQADSTGEVKDSHEGGNMARKGEEEEGSSPKIREGKTWRRDTCLSSPRPFLCSSFPARTAAATFSSFSSSQINKDDDDIAESVSTSFRRGSGEEETTSLSREFEESFLSSPSCVFCSSCHRHRKMTKPISHLCIRKAKRRSRCESSPNQKKRGVEEEKEEKEKSLIVEESLQSTEKNASGKERRSLAVSGNPPTDREEEKKKKNNSSTTDLDRNRYQETQRSSVTPLRRVDGNVDDEASSSSLLAASSLSQDPGKSRDHLPSSSTSLSVSRSAFSSLSFSQHPCGAPAPLSSSLHQSSLSHSCFRHSVFPLLQTCSSSSRSGSSPVGLPAAVVSVGHTSAKKEKEDDDSSSSSFSFSSPVEGEKNKEDKKDGEGKRDDDFLVEEMKLCQEDTILSSRRTSRRRRRDENRRREGGGGDEEGGKEREEVCLLRLLHREESGGECPGTCMRNHQDSQGEKDDKKERREKSGEKEDKDEPMADLKKREAKENDKEEEGGGHSKVNDTSSVTSKNHGKFSPPSNQPEASRDTPPLLGITEENERSHTSFPCVFCPSCQQEKKGLSHRISEVEKAHPFDSPIRRPLPAAFSLLVRDTSQQVSLSHASGKRTNRCYEEAFPSLLETSHEPRDLHQDDPKRHTGLSLQKSQVKTQQKKSFSSDSKATFSPCLPGRRKPAHVLRGSCDAVKTERRLKSREESRVQPSLLLMRSRGGYGKGEIERGEKKVGDFSKKKNLLVEGGGEDRGEQEEHEREKSLHDDRLLKVNKKKRRDMERRKSRDVFSERRTKGQADGIRVHTEKEGEMKRSSCWCAHEKSTSGRKELHVSSAVAFRWKRLSREEEEKVDLSLRHSSSPLPAIHRRSSSSRYRDRNISDDPSTRKAKRETNSKKMKKKKTSTLPCPRPSSSSPSLHKINNRATALAPGFFASSHNEELGRLLAGYRDRYLHAWKEAPQTTAPLSSSSYWSVGLPVPCSLLPRGWVEESLRGRDSRSCDEQDEEEEEKRKINSVTASCCKLSERRDDERTETSTAAEDEPLVSGKGRVTGRRREVNVKAEAANKDSRHLGSEQQQQGRRSAAGVLMVQALYNLEKEQLLLPSYHVYDKNGEFQGMLPYAAFIQYLLPKEEGEKRGEKAERTKKCRGKADENHGVVKNAGLHSSHLGRGKLRSGVCTASSGVCTPNPDVGTAHSGVRARHPVCSFHPESMAHRPCFSQASGVEAEREDVSSAHPGGEENTNVMVEKGRRQREKTVKKRQEWSEALSRSHQVSRLQGDIVANSKLSGCELSCACAHEKKQKRKTQAGGPGLATPLPVMKPTELTSLHEVVAKLYGSGASRTDVIRTWPAHPAVAPHRTSPLLSGKVEGDSRLGGIPAREGERKERNEVRKEQTTKSLPLGRAKGGGGEEEKKSLSSNTRDTTTGLETSFRGIEGQGQKQKTTEKSVEENSTSLKANGEDLWKKDLTDDLSRPVLASLGNRSLGSQKEKEKEGSQANEMNKKMNTRRPEGRKTPRGESEDCGGDVTRSKETEKPDGHEKKRLVEKRCSSEETENEEDKQRQLHQEHVEETRETQDAQEENHVKGESTASPPVQKVHVKRSQMKAFRGVFAALCYMAKALLEESSS